MDAERMVEIKFDQLTNPTPDIEHDQEEEHGIAQFKFYDGLFHQHWDGALS